MKKVLFISALALAFAACSNSANTEAGEAEEVATETQESVTYNVDLAASEVTWKGSKITGSSHTGTVPIQSGKINVEEGVVTAGNFVLDMTGLTNTDGMDEEKTAKLLGHLASPDFFNTAEHGTASFEVTEGTATDLTGNLTIKGITKSITFPYVLVVEENSATATASFSIDRAKWEVKFGSGSFFENLGDDLINDAIEFNVKLIASK